MIYLIHCKNLCKYYNVPPPSTTIIERESTEWDKIFASYSTDKGLITSIYTELKKLNSRTSNPINNWANKLKTQFSEEEIRMTK
jgi:hypothetical protein